MDSVVQGRYRILQRLGAGGMGTVYLGEHLLIRRKVAIKTLHTHHAQNPDIVERFHREALAATSVGNPHIVEVLDMGYFEDDGAPFMALEYLEGRDLGDLIAREGPLPIGRVVRIVLQACEALSAVHACGIVHRDLKPENLFLVQRGDTEDFVKVLDFGISKLEGAEGVGGRITVTGAALGTPQYMAPEQTQGLPSIDHRADLYALGGVLYYALTGRAPLEASNLPMLFVKICNEAPAPLSQIRAGIPIGLDAIVQRLLQKEPESRFSSCEELSHALRPYAGLDGSFELLRVEESREPGEVLALTQVSAPDAAHEEVPSSVSPSLAGAARTLSLKRPDRLGRFALLAALCVVGAVGFFVIRAPGSVVATERSGPRFAPPPGEQREELRTTVEAEPSSPQVPSVRIGITTEPADAELYLDGRRVENPFESDLPQSREARTVRVLREGFSSLEQKLVPLEPREVRLTLVRTPPEERQTSKSVARVTRANAHTQPKAPGEATASLALEVPSRPSLSEATPSSVASAPSPPAAVPAPAATRRALKSPF